LGSDIDDIKSNPGALRVYTSRLKFSKIGKDYQTNCPFHSDSNPSFQVFQKDGVWMWKCQSGGCGSGNCIQFVQKLDNLSFKAALLKVDEELGGAWETKKKQVEETFQDVGKEDEIKKIYPLDRFRNWEEALDRSSEAIKFLKESRGISYNTARRLRFGFRQDIGDIAGGNRDLADKGWLAIPCIVGDKIVSIEYRSIVSKEFRRQPGMGTALFNLETVDLLEPVYVTEGKFDAAVLEQAGFRAVSLPNATTKLTPEMRDQLMQADTRYLAGDTDPAGSAAMDKLWSELQERTYKITWPTGCKDANDTFLKHCGSDVEKFRSLVERLTEEARGTPMPNVTSLQEALLAANRTNLMDHPDRLRFPWPQVDRMAILLPGSVMALSATNTKQGKTVFQVNLTVAAALKQKEVVLNYQCELSNDEFSNMVAAHVLRKSRNHLTQEDYHEASRRLADSGCRYYIGRNPALNTVTQVLDLIEAAVRRLGATVVVLDHLHFICRNESNEIQAQANAMQRIKNMAVQYGLKFIVVGQPRKALANAKGKAIHVTDFKGSESFGSDSDAIYTIHRDFVKIVDPKNPPRDDYEPRTEVRMLGARAKGDGATFAELMFNGDIATFQSISYDTPPPEQGSLPSI
jgi:DNA primase